MNRLYTHTAHTQNNLTIAQGQKGKVKDIEHAEAHKLKKMEMKAKVKITNDTHNSSGCCWDIGLVETRPNTHVNYDLGGMWE